MDLTGIDPHNWEWGTFPQWLLVVTAICAAYFAFRQYRASKLFQILQFIERPEIREARYKLFLKREITKEDKWWDKDKDMIKVASDIAASYDIVWRVSKGSHRRLIRKYWSYSICWIYEDLESFVISRRDAGDRTAYQGFTNLYQEAKPFDPRTARKRRFWLLRLFGR